MRTEQEILDIIKKYKPAIYRFLSQFRVYPTSSHYEDIYSDCILKLVELANVYSDDEIYRKIRGELMHVVANSLTRSGQVHHKHYTRYYQLRDTLPLENLSMQYMCGENYNACEVGASFKKYLEKNNRYEDGKAYWLDMWELVSPHLSLLEKDLINYLFETKPTTYKIVKSYYNRCLKNRAYYCTRHTKEEDKKFVTNLLAYDPQNINRIKKRDIHKNVEIYKYRIMLKVIRILNKLKWFDISVLRNARNTLQPKIKIEENTFE